MMRTRVVRAGVAAMMLCLALVATARPTEGAWSDRANVKGAFASGAWGTDGTSHAETTSSRMATSVGTTGTAGPTSPIASNASRGAPGPDTKTSIGTSQHALSVGTVNSNVSVAGLRTHAQYAAVLAYADSSVKTLSVTANALLITTFDDLVALTSVASNGVMASVASCPRTGISTATTTSLTDLRASLLGGAVTALTVSGDTANAVGVRLGLLNLERVTVSLSVVRTATTVSAPADPTARAGLTATVVMTSDQRTLVIGPFVPALIITLTVPIVEADCYLNLP